MLECLLHQLYVLHVLSLRRTPYATRPHESQQLSGSRQDDAEIDGPGPECAREGNDKTVTFSDSDGGEQCSVAIMR